MISIRRKDLSFEPIFLPESHRELLLRDISSSELPKTKDLSNKTIQQDEGEHFLDEEVNRLLKEYQSRVFDREVKKLPLIRVRVECGGFDAMRIQRIEDKFRNRVANQGYYLIIINIWYYSIQF